MSAEPRLTEHERALYARQLRLPGVGEAGQLKLRAAKVLLLGAGGLGSPVGLYLAAAGVGTLGIADPDKVEVSNLHRQILHGFDTLGLPKTISAAEALSEINPGLKIALHPEGFTVENAAELVMRYDLVVDGTDNFPTRYLTNDACVLLKKPNVYGSIFRFEGQASVFAPHLGGPCYRCLYPEPPPPGNRPSMRPVPQPIACGLNRRFIMGQDGKPVLEKDVVADDKFMSGIMFYVKGVEGKIPGADKKK